MEELIGKKIKAIYRLPKTDSQEFGWYNSPVCIELEDGTKIIPSSDEEGNSPGCFYLEKDLNVSVLA